MKLFHVLDYVKYFCYLTILRKEFGLRSGPGVWRWVRLVELPCSQPENVLRGCTQLLLLPWFSVVISLLLSLTAGTRGVKSLL